MRWRVEQRCFVRLIACRLFRSRWWKLYRDYKVSNHNKESFLNADTSHLTTSRRSRFILVSWTFSHAQQFLVYQYFKQQHKLNRHANHVLFLSRKRTVISGATVLYITAQTESSYIRTRDDMRFIFLSAAVFICFQLLLHWSSGDDYPKKNFVLCSKQPLEREFWPKQRIMESKAQSRTVARQLQPMSIISEQISISRRSSLLLTRQYFFCFIAWFERELKMPKSCPV